MTPTTPDTSTPDTSTPDTETTRPDVVEVLTADHRRVEDLIARLKAASGSQPRRDLADELITELVKHSVVEELIVYPAMRTHLPDGDAAVDQDVREHEDLERTMKSLESADVDDPRFDELVRHLEEVLRLHVADEEANEFPMLRAAVPAQELVSMASAVRAAKAVVPTRPHPATGNDPASHALVGPAIGLVDRLRDRLSGRATG